MAAPLEALPDPPQEPVVLTIAGDNLVVWPHEERAYLIAQHALETEDHLKRAEGELRGKRALVTRLRTDQEKVAEQKRLGHEAREFIIELFDLWRTETGRRACKLSPERFDMVAARLDEEYEQKHLVMAVLGIALAPFVIEGEARNDFDTALKDGASVERYANRCPRERRDELLAGGRLFIEGPDVDSPL